MSSTAQFVSFGPFFSAGALVTAPKLYHYIVGTTTDKDVWTTRAKSATAAQPVVGDANGVVSCYADGIYKMVIKDSADNTLYTWDNYTVAEPSVLGSDWINVKDFGAVGDGSGNDGPSIRDAINAGSYIWFPPGTYRITDDSLASLTAASHGGITLMGGGVEVTILNFANGSNDCIKADGTNSGAGQFNGFRISSMSLKSTSKTGGRMIAVSYAYKVLLDNLYIECWTGIEAYVTNNFDLMHVNIQSVTGGGSAPSSHYGPVGQAPANCYGLFWHAPSDGTYRSDALRAFNFTVQASFSGADGILWDGGASTFDAYQCTVLECDYGLRVRNTGASGANYPQFGEFHNFNVDGAMTQGVRIEAGQGFRFIGCNLSNTSGAVGQGNADTNALFVTHDEPNSYTRNLVFEGCTISNCRQDTVNVAARNVRFHGCAIYDGSKQTANTYNGLTIAAESEDVVVVGNGVGLYGANNQYKYAIEVKDTTVRLNVSSNQLYGYSTKGILWGNNDSSSICQGNASDGTPSSQDIIPFVNPQAKTVTGNFTATAAEFVNGILVLSGTPGAHNMTTPTAALIVGAIYSPSPGKGIQLHLINATNGTTSWVAGSGVTLAGATPFSNASGAAKIYTIRVDDIRAGSEAVAIYG